MTNDAASDKCFSFLYFIFFIASKSYLPFALHSGSFVLELLYQEKVRAVDAGGSVEVGGRC